MGIHETPPDKLDLMDNIKQNIAEATKQAMRAQDKTRLAVLRFIQAACKQKEIDERIEIDNAAAIAILKKLVKQRKESLACSIKANRKDLEQQEQLELAIIQEFLPTTTVATADLQTIITQALAHVQAKSPADIGKTMAYLKEQLKDSAVDFAEVSSMLKEMLKNLANG